MGIRTPIGAAFGLPSLYFAEEITGLVYTAPFLISAFIVAIANRPGAREITDNQGALSRWLSAALGGSFLSGFAVFLVFFWASERYLLDFIPCALLLAMFGFWQGTQSARGWPFGRAALISVGLLLLLISALISSLLAIAQNADGFRALNPILWQQLNNLFRP